jgi:hypothetical protein
MRNQVDINVALSRAIIREIGERLQALLGEDELPASLKSQLDRFNQLDDHLTPLVVPEQKREADSTALARQGLVSPGWTARWRRLRRAQK